MSSKAPIQRIQPSHVVTHAKPSHLDRPATITNMRNASTLNKDFAQKHPQAVQKIGRQQTDYRGIYRQEAVSRENTYRSYYSNDHFHFYYSGWYSKGFYGGYYYPVRPYVQIDTDFTYPCVAWMFDPYYDATDYSDYSTDSTDSSDYPVSSFNDVGVFYPTDTIRDLGIEVSGLSYALQANFRTALSILVDSLAAQISANLNAPITLERNDIVVNHYENLNGTTYVLEGFVDRSNIHYAFKALVDLQDPSQTVVFVPGSQDPTQADTAALDQINQRIVDLGGNPYVADEEPTK